MMVMPANNRGVWVGYLAALFPNRIGSLISPGGWVYPVPFLPYALDNGAFTGFDEAKFFELIDRALAFDLFQKPMWIAVPDKVADRNETLRLWSIWYPRLSVYKIPLAFVAQDGMTPGDIPSEADVLFVGGSTSWKIETIPMWCYQHKHVHVGRVNTYGRLVYCHEHGAKSCDGTGFFRGNERQLNGLIKYLSETR